MYTTAQRQARLGSLFEQLDRDNNGTLELEELRVVAGEQSEQLVVQMDTDQDGNVSRFEFTQLLLDAGADSGAYEFDEYMHEMQSRINCARVQPQIANSATVASESAARTASTLPAADAAPNSHCGSTLCRRGHGQNMHAVTVKVVGSSGSGQADLVAKLTHDIKRGNQAWKLANGLHIEVDCHKSSPGHDACTDILLVTFDLTSQSAIENAYEYYRAAAVGGCNAESVVLVGTKCDLKCSFGPSDSKAVVAQIQQDINARSRTHPFYIKTVGIVNYTSSETGFGFEDLERLLIHTAQQRYWRVAVAQDLARIERQIKS